MHTLSLRDLWYLKLVVAHGSFAAAGRAAGVSQPAISQAMQRLEKSLAVPLFDREGRQKRPTVHSLRAVEKMANVGDVFGSFQPGSKTEGVAAQTSSTSLTVGLAPAAALLYGPKLESVWRRHAPDGLLRIVSQSATEMLMMLMNQELDLVIAPQPRKFRQGQLRRHRLHTSTPMVYARIGHSLASASSLEELAGAAWAVAGQSGTAGNVIEEACRVRHLAPPRILVQCGDYPALVHLVASSEMLCVVPHESLLPDNDRERIQAVHLREGLPRYEVTVFSHDAPREPVVTAINEIVEALTVDLADH